jgi:hypothetical protein
MICSCLPSLKIACDRVVESAIMFDLLQRTRWLLSYCLEYWCIQKKKSLVIPLWADGELLSPRETWPRIIPKLENRPAAGRVKNSYTQRDINNLKRQLWVSSIKPCRPSNSELQKAARHVVLTVKLVCLLNQSEGPLKHMNLCRIYIIIFYIPEGA